jgi:hypothetical protein
MNNFFFKIKHLRNKTKIKGKKAKKKKVKVEPFVDEADRVSDMAGEIWKEDIDTYPIRDPSEDAPWAVFTVRLWVGVALAAIVFIIVLSILGAIFD